MQTPEYILVRINTESPQGQAVLRQFKEEGVASPEIAKLLLVEFNGRRPFINNGVWDLEGLTSAIVRVRGGKEIKIEKPARALIPD